MGAFRGVALAVLLFLLPAHGAAAAPAAPAGATLAGIVQDADTGEPIARALVALPDLERAVITGPDGRYAFEGVPPGPHHIRVRFIGYTARTLHALVPREGLLEINVSLRPEPLRIEPLDVRAPVIVRGVEPGATAAFPDRQTSIAAIRNHPLLTEPDAFQALEGGEIVLRPETPSGIHVRGGSTEHLAYQIDGIPVFSPYHAAGVTSAWNPDVLSRLELASSGFPAANPHTLTGALDGITRMPGQQLGVQGSVSATQARVTFDGPLGRAGEAGYLVSLRAGFTGLLNAKREGSHLRGDTGDWLAKLHAGALGGRLRILGYESTNEIEAASTTDPPMPGQEAPRNFFDWQSRSHGLEWRRPLGSGAVRVLGWTAAGDARATWSAEAAPVRLSAERRDLGILADIEKRSSRGSFLSGLRVERTKTSYRVESDSASVPDRTLEARTPVTSAFAQLTRKLGPPFELDLGASLASNEGNLYTSPRARIRWTASPRLSLTGGYARSHQFTQSLRNAESIVGTIFPVDLHVGAGAPGVPVARSHQGVIAADYRPAAGVRLTLQGYVRGSDRLLLVAPRAGEPFTLGSFIVGSGNARGVSLDAGVSGARYGVVASYGFQRVRFDHSDSTYVPEHGAEHLLESGIIVFPTSTLSVRLGGAAAWGRRTTTASGTFEWEACNLLDRGCEFAGSPHYNGEPLGGTSLPPYYRVDLGVRKHWHIGAGGRDVSIAFFAAVTNLLGRKNVLTYTRDPATGEVAAVEMRPRSPLVAGLDWRF